MSLPKKIAEKSKLFTEGEFIKDCLSSAAGTIEDWANDLDDFLRSIVCIFFSIALDESTDVTHISQLAVF